MTSLRELPIGKTATIRSVGGEGALRQHFLDMGMVPGVVVSVVKFAPMGDPMEIKIHGYELSLRLSEAEKIEISDIETVDKSKQKSKTIHSPALSASHRRAKMAALDTSGSVWASCITTMVQRGFSAG